MLRPDEQVFIDRLAQGSKARVDYTQIIKIYQEIYPEARDEPRLRARLIDVLQRAKTAGHLSLPSRPKDWLAGSPLVPKWIRLIRPKPEAPRPDPAVWVPIMAFAAKLTNPRQRADALAINDYLKAARTTSTTVPSRERSLQIFGDEKRLDALVDTQGRLFGGRLTLADLQCSRIPLPLPYQSPDEPAAGRPMLILENHHSYWSFCTWNRQSRQYAAIAYGSGNAFGTSVEHLDLIAAESGAVGLHYLGDIDLTGLRIPVRANRKRLDAGLRPLEPAHWWYQWLLRHGGRQHHSCPVISPDDRDELAQWLGEGLWPDIHRLLLDGRRIPQESLGLEVLIGAKC